MQLEYSGDIHVAGRFIVDQVFQKARKWQTDFPDLMAGFNVSYLQFRDSGFVDYLIQKANEYELNPGYLCIELTKSSRADDFDTLAGCFEKLRSFGVRISPDDFGIACSTLLLIRNLPVGSVKLDHSFTLLQGYVFDRPMPAIRRLIFRAHPGLSTGRYRWK